MKLTSAKIQTLKSLFTQITGKDAEVEIQKFEESKNGNKISGLAASNLKPITTPLKSEEKSFGRRSSKND